MDPHVSIMLWLEIKILPELEPLYCNGFLSQWEGNPYRFNVVAKEHIVTICGLPFTWKVLDMQAIRDFECPENIYFSTKDLQLSKQSYCRRNVVSS